MIAFLHQDERRGPNMSDRSRITEPTLREMRLTERQWQVVQAYLRETDYSDHRAVDELSEIEAKIDRVIGV